LNTLEQLSWVYCSEINLPKTRRKNVKIRRKKTHILIVYSIVLIYHNDHHSLISDEILFVISHNNALLISRMYIHVHVFHRNVLYKDSYGNVEEETGNINTNHHIIQNAIIINYVLTKTNETKVLWWIPTPMIIPNNTSFY
jgi:hypothetical protein